MAVGDIEIFEGLSTVEQAKLLGLMERIEYPAGALVFNQGDQGDGMYVILSGSIEIFTVTGDGQKNLLAVLEGGQSFGEMALLMGELRSASAAAAEDSVLLKMGLELFDRIISENSSVSAAVSRLLCRRLSRTNRALDSLKTSQMQMVVGLVNQWSEDLRLPLLSAALLPAALLPNTPLDFLARYYGLHDLGARIESLVSSRTHLVRLNDDKDHLLFDPSTRELFARIYRAETGPAERERFLDAAAEHFLKHLRTAEAVGLYVENGCWTQALKVVKLHDDDLAGDPELREQLFGILEAVPEEYLLKDYELFLSLLDKYLEGDAARGLTKTESALSLVQVGLSEPQKARLYQYAARFCLKLGLQPKATEYLQLALSYSPAPYDDSIQLGSLSVAEALSAGQSERALQMAKHNVESAWRISLAQKAGRWFEKSRFIQLAALAGALFAVLYFSQADPITGLDSKGMRFLGITLAAIILWVVEIIPPYLVALLMAMAWVVVGLVKAETALAGFANPIWLFSVGVLGLSAAISKSGLLYRLSLLILRFFPSHYRGQVTGLAVSGLALSPLIPSAIAKAALGSHFALNLSESMGFKHRSRGAAGLGLTSLIFFGMTTPFFLTAGVTNFLALGLIPQAGASWLQWLWWSLPLLAVFSLGMLAAILLLFNPQNSDRRLSPLVLNQQIATLGRITRQEIITLLVVAVVILTLMLQPYHRLEGVWVVLGGFSLLVVGGLLDKNTIKSGIDWSFLLYLGVTFSFAGVASQLGVTDWLASLLTEWLRPFTGSPYVFLPSLALLVFLTTFVIQGSPAVVMLVISLLPLAGQVGIHPWLLIFIILLTSDPFFFSYQSTTYLTAYYGADEKSFTHQQGRALAVCFALVCILGIILCVPFWQYTGLIK